MTSPEENWTRLSKQLARKVNLAWFLQKLTVPLVLSALLLGTTLITLRYFEKSLNPTLPILLTLSLLITLILTWRFAKPHFLTPSQALTRLEADLRLHNSLSTAAAGRAPWPTPPEKLPTLFSWNLGRTLGPLSSALIFLLMGLLIPITPAKPPLPANSPYSWGQLEADVEQLVDSETIQEDYAEQLKKNLEELREQKAEEWFSASSLEATDALRRSHKNEVARLERNMKQVAQALERLADPKTTEQARAQMQQQFADAVEQMQKGEMKPNKDLLEKLGQAAQDALGNLTPEEKAELEKQLREKARELAESFDGSGEDPGPGEGEGEGENEGQEPGDQAGQGGIDRGPGTSRNLYGDPSQLLNPKRFEHLDAQNEEEPEPGELLELRETDHDQDIADRAVSQSADTANKGSGGDRVWKESLIPAEQRSLRQFFE